MTRKSIPKHQESHSLDRLERARRLSARGLSPEQARDPKQVERFVFAWLLTALNRTAPQIPLRPDILGEIDDVLGSIARRKPPSRLAMSWSTIFSYIEWQTPDQVAFCGEALLQFFGELSEALLVQGYVVVPRWKLIERMMFVLPDKSYLRYEYRRKGRSSSASIASTPEGEKAFGFPVRIRIPSPAQGGYPDERDDLSGEGSTYL